MRDIMMSQAQRSTWIIAPLHVAACSAAVEECKPIQCSLTWQLGDLKRLDQCLQRQQRYFRSYSELQASQLAEGWQNRQQYLVAVVPQVDVAIVKVGQQPASQALM
jgi:hypothetical protein